MTKRRFSAQETTVKRELRSTINKIEATSLKISQDEFSGEVEVIFDRNGKRYTKKCSKWENSLDNLRAIQLSIEYLYRAIEIYGIESQEEFNSLFNQMFVGIEATPDDSILKVGNETNWWDILQVKKESSKKDIQNAFRSMARIHHPDMGGNPEQFKKLRKAYDEALREDKTAQ